MLVPHVYAEWVQVLESLKQKENDAEVLSAMQKGSIAWQSGVAERFSKKLVEAVNFRMNRDADKFQNDLKHAGSEERLIIQALLALRKDMQFLLQAVNLPAIPEEIREEYCRLVKDQADNMQRSLEDSAKTQDWSGKLSSILRNHKINKFKEENGD